jgi:hypothetical protein
MTIKPSNPHQLHTRPLSSDVALQRHMTRRNFQKRAIALGVVSMGPTSLLGQGRLAAQEGDDSHPPDSPRVWAEGRLVGEHVDKMIRFEVRDGQAIFEGDIILGPANENIFSLVRPGDTYRWPVGTIAFEIDPSVTSTLLGHINQAITIWRRDTPLTVVDRTGANAAQFPDYVVFTQIPAGEHCWSHVGRVGGQQTIELEEDCEYGHILHEIGHAVGLWHEQSRDDRDRWVTILWENIQDDARSQFNQHISDGDDVGPYDFDSIMHYQPTAFGKVDPANPPQLLPTIESIPPGEAFGQRDHLSDGDLLAIRTLYPLNRNWDWSDDRQIAGQTSRTPPALSTFVGAVHMIHLGESSHKLWHSWTTDGETWSDDKEIGGQSSQAVPAMAALGDTLHMVHLGESTKTIWHSWWTGGDDWNDDEALPGKTSQATPALVAFDGALHMIHIGESSTTMYYSRSDDGRRFSVDSPIRGKFSRTTPALVDFDGELHMVHLGESSNKLWHSWSTNGRDWSEDKEIRGQSTRVAPALGVFEGALHLVHLGESSERLWYSRSEDGRTWTEDASIPGHSSRAAVGLSSHRGGLIMVHIGESSENLWGSRLVWTP